MRNYLVFNGINCSDYGVYISGQGTFDSPTREYEAQPVPGRNGDILATEKRFENLDVEYPAFIYTDFEKNLAGFREAMLASEGYCRLEDTYHPEEYRLAFFRGDITPKVRSRNDAGEFTIRFNCKPQRFLKLGEVTQEISSGGSILNPTLFDSQPLIKVTGYGQLTINSNVITIANTYTYVYIDSEIMDCYSGTSNANPDVVFTPNEFPVLHPGANGITFDNTITKLEITPRWWRV